MQTAALFIALFVFVLGALGFIVPDTFVLVARYAATPVGIYVVALVRIGVGLVLLRAAPASRSVVGLRIVGGLAFFSGLVTPLLGLGRVRDAVEWWAAQGAWAIRAWALVAVALGVFIGWAVTDGHGAAVRRARRVRAST